jgi:hypothetical protein
MIRHFLYDKTKLRPIFNPIEPIGEDLPKPLVIDLDIDVSNRTRIVHPHTDEIIAMLASANAIVCDTAVLANTIRPSTKSLICVAPFGFATVTDNEFEKGFAVGLLNHEDVFQMENLAARAFLKKFEYQYLVFGEEIAELENQLVLTDFNQFASLCDVLLLPGALTPPLPIAVPLSVMMAGTAVIAARTSSYYALQAQGVRYLEPTLKPAPWRKAIEILERDPVQLEYFKKHNKQYAQRVTSESVQLVSRLELRINRN